GEIQPSFSRGDVQAAFGSAALGQTLSRNVGAKVLAVAALARLPELPDVPTMREAGLPGLEVSSWLSAIGPTGIPRDTLSRLEREIQARFAKPEVQARLSKLGPTPKASTSEELTNRVAREIALWKDVVDKANIKVSAREAPLFSSSDRLAVAGLR